MASFSITGLNKPQLNTNYLLQDDDGFLEETDIFVPPDGGYGWFVALGAFITLMWTAGTVITPTKGGRMASSFTVL